MRRARNANCRSYLVEEVLMFVSIHGKLVLECEHFSCSSILTEENGRCAGNLIFHQSVYRSVYLKFILNLLLSLSPQCFSFLLLSIRSPKYDIHSASLTGRWSIKNRLKPCHLLKPNWKPYSSHSISIPTNISTQFLLQSVSVCVCVCVCVCVRACACVCRVRGFLK